MIKNITMKSFSKWHIVLMLIIPIIILPLVFYALGIFKVLPSWAIIWIVLIPILSIPFFLITYSKAQSTSLQKRQKWLLIVEGVFIVFLLIMTMITHVLEIPLWQIILSNKGLVASFSVGFLVFLCQFLYLGKKRKTTDTIENGSLRKNRKWLLVLSGIFIVSLSVIAAIYITQGMHFSLKILFFVAMILTLLYIFSLFFPKEKEATESDSQNNVGNLI